MNFEGVKGAAGAASQASDDRIALRGVRLSDGSERTGRGGVLAGNQKNAAAALRCARLIEERRYQLG